MLRGFAALAVVLSHIEHWNKLNSGTAPNESVLSIGVFAVYIFFVISGFVIYYTHQNELGRRRNLSKFIIKRSFRIYPAYWFFSGVNLILAWFAFSTWDHGGSLSRSIAEIASAITLLPFAPTNEWCAFLVVGWALFFEVVFYLMFAFFFINKIAGYAVLAGHFFLCFAIGYSLLGGVYFLSKIAILFSIGSVIAVVTENIQFPKLYSCLLITTGVIAYVTAILVCVKHPGLGKAFAMTSAIMLVLGTVNMDFVDPTLCANLWMSGSAWLGNISFSLYLCHAMVGSIVFHYVGAPQESMINAAFYVICPILVATLSYKYIEKPFLLLAKKICSASVVARRRFFKML